MKHKITLLLLALTLIFVWPIPRVYGPTADKRITYDATTNIINAINGTFADQIDFEDLWSADKAGELLLEPSKTYNSTEIFSLDRQVRPTDKKAIHISIVVTARSGPNEHSLFIIGNDLHGETISDSFLMYDLQSYNTTASFSSIVANGLTLTVPPGNNITFHIIQRQWGVVWKTSSTQYTFDARILLGNGTSAGTTYFKDTKKQITLNNSVVTANYQTFIDAHRPYVYITFGALEDATNKLGSQGISLISLESTRYATYLVRVDSKSYFYGSSFTGGNGRQDRFTARAFSHVFNCIFEEVDLYGSDCVLDVHDVTIRGAYGGIYYTTGVFDTLRLYKNDYAFILATTYAFTVNNAYSRLPNINFIRTFVISTHKYLINVDSDEWTFNWGSGNTANIYRQYSFKINVTDTEGNPIQNANVTMTDLDGQQEFSVLSGSNGSFAEQIITYGFYNQTGGNVAYMKTPHNLTISQASYDTLSYLLTVDAQQIKGQVIMGPPRTLVIFQPAFFLLGGICFIPFILLGFVWRKRQNANRI